MGNNAEIRSLAELLDVQRLEQDEYFAPSVDFGFATLFGGQVLGQSVVAAARSMPPDRVIHSLHAYFLRPGDASEGVRYTVKTLRYGATFSACEVSAQQGGRTILTMLASFQRPERGHEFQKATPPPVSAAHELINDLDALRAQSHILPEKSRERLIRDRFVDLRTIDRFDHTKPQARDPHSHSWMRPQHPLGSDLALHQGALAYASDFGISGVAMLPHGLSFFTPNLHVTSLDHAMWFHHYAAWDSWCLYARESNISSGARGMNRGEIFDDQGRLIASVAQESLIRIRS